MYIQCPICLKVYGEKRGNQPPGAMKWTYLNRSLPGYGSTRTIQITYELVMYFLIILFLIIFIYV